MLIARFLAPAKVRVERTQLLDNMLSNLFLSSRGCQSRHSSPMQCSIPDLRGWNVLNCTRVFWCKSSISDVEIQSSQGGFRNSPTVIGRQQSAHLGGTFNVT